MPTEAKFTTSLTRFVDTPKNGGKPIDVILFLSMGKNRKGESPQADENLLAFIQLVNRNRILQTRVRNQPRLAISKVRIVLSGEGLFEVYVGKERAQTADKTWVDAQVKLLSQNLAPEFKFNPTEDVISWQQATNNPLYARALFDIQKLYDEDRELQRIINEKLIPEHVHRYQVNPHDGQAAKQAVKEYVFRESAAFLCWGGVVCYPSPSFNEASQYILERLTGKGSPPYPGASYLGYEFRTFASVSKRVDVPEHKRTQEKGKVATSPEEIIQDTPPDSPPKEYPIAATSFTAAAFPMPIPFGLFQNSSSGFFKNPQKCQSFLDLAVQAQEALMRAQQASFRAQEEYLMFLKRQQEMGRLLSSGQDEGAPSTQHSPTSSTPMSM